MSNFVSVSDTRNGNALGAITGCNNCRRRARFIAPDDSSNFVPVQQCCQARRCCNRCCTCCGTGCWNNGCGNNSCWNNGTWNSDNWNGNWDWNGCWNNGCNTCGGSCIQPRYAYGNDVLSVTVRGRSRAGRSVLHAPGMCMPGPNSSC